MIHPAVIFFTWQHLRRERARCILLILSFGFASGLLMLVSTLGLGLERLVTQRILTILPDNMVQITAPEMQFTFLQRINLTTGQQVTGLSPQIVRALSKLAGVRAAYPRLPVPVALSAQGGQRLLGRTLRTDVFIEGVDPELFRQEPFFSAFAKSYPNAQHTVPVVLSTKLLDLYNQMVAPSLKTPNLQTLDLIGFEFDLRIGASVFAQTGSTSDRQLLHARVVGFSPHAATLGLSIPLDAARNIRDEFGHLTPAQESYSHILLELDSPKTLLQLLPSIERMGLVIDQTAHRTQRWISIARMAIQGFGLTALMMSGWFLGYIMWLYGDAKRHHFALLEALGLSARDILMLVMLQSMVCGLLGGLLGLLATRALTMGANILIGQDRTLQVLQGTGLVDLPWSVALSCVILTVGTATIGGLPAALRVWQRRPSAFL